VCVYLYYLQVFMVVRGSIFCGLALYVHIFSRQVFIVVRFVSCLVCLFIFLSSIYRC
jgi:hypothetical protein